MEVPGSAASILNYKFSSYGPREENPPHSSAGVTRPPEGEALSSKNTPSLNHFHLQTSGPVV